MNIPEIVDFGYTEELSARSYTHYSDWVDAGFFGEMNYLADQRKESRKNIQLVFPKAQSVLTFLFSYEKIKRKRLPPKIAGFALGFKGRDYHHVLKEQLTTIGRGFQKFYPDLEFITAIDTLPILERDLAYRAGLGFIGKNSMLISPKHGSYFMIGSLIFSKKLPLSQKKTMTDHCGNCTRCLDACPTSAILPNRTINAKQCISHFTVELFKDAPLPKGLTSQQEEIFGCDICQDVCPWNRAKRFPLDSPFSSPSPQSPKEKEIYQFFFGKTSQQIFQELSALSNNGYKKLFSDTSFLRLGKKGLLKNLKRFN